MKSLLLVCLFFGFSQAAFADMGAFFITKSTYLYSQIGGGTKQLTRKKQAYPVLESKQVGKASLLYRIRIDSTRQSAGTGFVVQTDLELQTKKGELIKVYLEPPTKTEQLGDFHWVPGELLLATGTQEQSELFPELEFRAVSYKGVIPQFVWVDSWAGIYRPDKSANFLNMSWDTLSQTETDKGKAKRILMGLVELGYTKDEVKLALGAPLKEEALPGGELQWVYLQKKVIFEKGKVTRTL